jgi:hypothetical protein
MQGYTKSLLTMAVLAVSLPLLAQERFHPDLDLSARFSYESSAANQTEGVQRICFAVSDSGDYRIVQASREASVRLHGKLSDDEFKEFKALALSADFRALPKDHVGVIRQESQSFVAQIPSGWQGNASALRLRWLNADGESPFPAPAAKVIKWLKDFEPKGGKQFEYTEFPDVCPSAGLQLLQPSVAANQITRPRSRRFVERGSLALARRMSSRREDFHAVPALLLGRAEAQVGLVQKFGSWPVPLLGAGRYADADRG